jgi:hypothetical protein
VIYPLNASGNSIAGSTIAMVINDIKPLRNNQWAWDPTNGFLTITDPSVYIDAGDTLFIIYTQAIS